MGDPEEERQDWPANVRSPSDARDRLANERTFLAWIRTSLGFIAAGIAIAYLGPEEVASRALGLVAIAAGAAIALGGHLRWKNNDANLSRGLPLSVGSLPALTTGLTLLAALAAVLLTLWQIIVSE